MQDSDNELEIRTGFKPRWCIPIGEIVYSTRRRAFRCLGGAATALMTMHLCGYWISSEVPQHRSLNSATDRHRVPSQNPVLPASTSSSMLQQVCQLPCSLQPRVSWWWWCTDAPKRLDHRSHAPNCSPCLCQNHPRPEISQPSACTRSLLRKWPLLRKWLH